MLNLALGGGVLGLATLVGVYLWGRYWRSMAKGLKDDVEKADERAESFREQADHLGKQYQLEQKLRAEDVARREAVIHDLKSEIEDIRATCNDPASVHARLDRLLEKAARPLDADRTALGMPK